MRAFHRVEVEWLNLRLTLFDVGRDPGARAGGESAFHQSSDAILSSSYYSWFMSMEVQFSLCTTHLLFNSDHLVIYRISIHSQANFLPLRRGIWSQFQLPRLWSVSISLCHELFDASKRLHLFCKSQLHNCGEGLHILTWFTNTMLFCTCSKQRFFVGLIGNKLYYLSLSRGAGLYSATE